MSTKAAKKNTLMNVLMVVAIVLIAAAGVLTVGKLRGWFDKPEEDGLRVEVTDKLGSANIYREGIAYALPVGTALRSGDELEVLGRSSLTLAFGESTLQLGEDTRLRFTLEDGQPLFAAENGTFFADLRESAELDVHGNRLNTEDAVLTAAVPYGSASVGVLSGKVVCGTLEAGAGKTLSLLSEEAGGSEVVPLSLSSLDSFALERLSAVEEERGCVFTPEDVAALKAQREQEAQAALEARLLEGEEEARIAELREKAAENGGTVEAGEDSVDLRSYCTIEIRCDTILNNMENLTEGKNAYVPSNGTILAASRLSFTEGETVFEVLRRACSLAGIQLEYAWTPLYNSYYIEGINNLYEFDCGEESGWMYKVNGWFPNYGCSSYKLKDGDTIVWCYTCKGIGADVGGSVY